jgi:hypothetical protein
MVESAVIYRHIAMNGQPQSCKGNLRLIGEDDRRWLRRRYFVLGVGEDGSISARCRMPSCGLRPVKRSNFRVIAALPIEPVPEMDPRFSLDESISTRSQVPPYED